jgi:hypothetical protein
LAESGGTSSYKKQFARVRFSRKSSRQAIQALDFCYQPIAAIITGSVYHETQSALIQRKTLNQNDKMAYYED